MRIGVLGDVHGNLEALRSVAAALRGCGAEVILNAGDTVGYSPFPDECVRLLGELCAVEVQGNYDDAVAALRADCGCGPAAPGIAAIRAASLAWTQRRVTPGTRERLRGLPLLRWLVFERCSLLLSHGQVDDHDGPALDEAQRAWARRAGATGAHVVVLGHSHRPAVERIAGTTFVNPGSVGKPVDGDPRASCALLEIEGGRVSAHLLRVPYDVERNVAALTANGLPAEIGWMLRRGSARPAQA